MSNDPPRDLAEPNRARTSLTRRHWLYAFLWIVAGSGVLLKLRNKYHRHQRRVARDTLRRLGAGGGRRTADGGYLVSSVGMGNFDDPEHYDFIILRGKEVTDAGIAALREALEHAEIVD